MSGSRNSRPLPPDRSYGDRQNPGGSYPQRGSGANWGSGSPNQSYSRRNDPGASYSRRDSYDDDRGLMLPPDAGPLMPLDDRNLPALPSEEEERALGIRRPAFIPATDTRKGQKPGRWRVISGVASVMVLCLAMCGLSSLLVQKNVLPQFTKLLGFKSPAPVQVGHSVIPTQYPQTRFLVTQTANQKTPIISIGTYRATIKSSAGTVNAQQPSSVFYVNDFVYAVMLTDQSVKSGDSISAKWTFNNVDITNELKLSGPDCCNITIDKTNSAKQIVFAIKAEVPGYGMLQVSYNNTMAYTVLFYVAVQPSSTTPTTVPGTPGTTPGITPTAKP